MKRSKMSRGHSRKAFSRNAGTHSLNRRERPMRGGWRL